MRRMYPPGFGPISDVQPSGPAPVLARVHEWARVAPLWEGYMAQVRRRGDWTFRALAASRLTAV